MADKNQKFKEELEKAIEELQTQLASKKFSLEDIELELIDFGVEEVFQDDGYVLLYASFDNYGKIQKELEDRSLEIISSGFDRIPQITNKLLPEQEDEVLKLLEKIEEDEDVQNIYHTLDFQE